MANPRWLSWLEYEKDSIRNAMQGPGQDEWKHKTGAGRLVRRCMRYPLQEDSEAEEHAAEDSDRAEGSVWHEAGRCSADLGCAGGGGLLSTEASDRDLVCGRGAAGLRGGSHGGRKGGIAQVRGLGTTGMVGPALAPAGVVAIAVGHTVVAPGLADEEGQRLRVLGDVWNDAVFAHT